MFPLLETPVVEVGTLGFARQRTIGRKSCPVLVIVLLTGSPFRPAGLERILVSNHLALKVGRQGGVVFGQAFFFDSLTCQQLLLHNDGAGRALEKGSGKRRAIETIFNWTAAKSCMVQGKGREKISRKSNLKSPERDRPRFFTSPREE